MATFAEVSDIVDRKLSDRKVWDLLMEDEVGVALVVGLLDDRVQNVSRQLTQGGGDADWERKARNYRSLCQRRLTTAKAAEKAWSVRNNARSQAWESATRQLAVAIAKHKHRSRTSGIEPEPHDVALWEALTTVDVPADRAYPEDRIHPADYITTGEWAA